MRKILYAALILSWLAACIPAGGAGPDRSPVVPTDRPAADIRILAFGDSLTAGFGVDSDQSYPARLETRLRADGHDVDVINGGISGETSSAALARLDWMLNTQPDIVIVEIGGNDALRGVDLALTAENIDQIVRRFSEEDVLVIVAGMQIIQNLGQDYAQEFAAIYPATAERHGAILIPFFLEGVATDPALNQPDFIHPNAAGYAVLVEHIYPFVLEAIDRVR